MEENSESTNVNPLSAGDNSAGDSLRIEKVDQFERALDRAKTAIRKSCEEDKNIIGIWGFFSLLLVIFAFIVGFWLYDDAKVNVIDTKLTSTLIYGAIIRITILTAIFSLLNYTLKNLRSYLHIYQRNRHRLYLVHSLSSIIDAGYDFLDHRNIFEQVIKILLKADQTGLLRTNKRSSSKENMVFQNTQELIHAQMELIKALGKKE